MTFNAELVFLVHLHGLSLFQLHPTVYCTSLMYRLTRPRGGKWYEWTQEEKQTELVHMIPHKTRNETLISREYYCYSICAFPYVALGIIFLVVILSWNISVVFDV